MFEYTMKHFSLIHASNIPSMKSKIGEVEEFSIPEPVLEYILSRNEKVQKRNIQIADLRNQLRLFRLFIDTKGLSGEFDHFFSETTQLGK